MPKKRGTVELGGDEEQHAKSKVKKSKAESVAATSGQAAAKSDQVESSEQSGTNGAHGGKNKQRWSDEEDAVIIEELISTFKPDWKTLASRIKELDAGRDRPPASVTKHWEQTLKTKVIAMLKK